MPSEPSADRSKHRSFNTLNINVALSRLSLMDFTYYLHSIEHLKFLNNTKIMKSLFALAFASIPLLSAAYIVDPPTTAAPDTIEDCTYWHVAEDADTCASMSAYWGLTEAQLAAYVCQYFVKMPT